MICPKCKSHDTLQTIYKNNNHAEYSSNETTYYQCQCCGIHVRTTMTRKTEWSQVGYLSDTLA